MKKIPTTNQSSMLSKVSLVIFLGLLAYTPLHIFISTWLGTSFGVLDFTKVLKDIVLVVGFLLIFMPSVKQDWFKSFIKDRLILLILVYAGLSVLLALVKSNHLESELLAIVYNLRYLLFFVYGMLLTRYFEPKWLLRKSLEVVLAVGTVVMLFGAVQYLFLPNDALTHVGYQRANGVLPAFFIDEKPDLERAMSTVRDPNSYGAYLLIILAILIGAWIWKRHQNRGLLAGLITLAVANLYFTFSRSAWIGAVVTLFVLFGLYFKSKKKYKISYKLWLPAVVLLVVLAGATVLARDTYFVKNVILHADESTVLEDPNELRVKFWRESLEASAENPLGHGPGTAGIVSIRNNEQGVVLTENYYLQILYEVGIIGLILFVAILAVVALRLYQYSDKWQAAALLAAFLGIAASNLLNHIWTVEAVAYTWWGLAGLTVLLGNKFKEKA